MQEHEFDIIGVFADDSAVRYAGGKGKCFQRLINLMPEHETYIESHLGGGAVIRHKRPAATNIGIDVDSLVIERWRAEYPGVCELINADATEFLKTYSYTGREFIYADPPYVAAVRRRRRVYRHDLAAEDHAALLETLRSVTCMVMVSGYDNALYNDVLRRWRKVSFDAKTHVDVRQECVWMNFDAPASLHDTSYLGDTFRSRQDKRRRIARALDKFARMDPLERAGLLTVLLSRYGTQVDT
jgi:DNA adenine methylase